MVRSLHSRLVLTKWRYMLGSIVREGFVMHRNWLSVKAVQHLRAFYTLAVLQPNLRAGPATLPAPARRLLMPPRPA